MVTVKIVNDILSGEMKTLSVDEGITIETIFRENIDENSYSGTLVECYDLETGRTYFAPIEENEDAINAVILVNGKDSDLSYELKNNDIVSIIITPASGGSGSGWSWWGALIGNVVGSFEGALAGTAYGGLGWGTLIGAIIGGVIGFIAGGIIGGAINADDIELKEGVGSDGLNSERLADVRGATNQPLLNNPYPMVIGKHVTAPFIVGSPYNEISGQHGEENYIQVLYCVGYAPLRITDLKLGEQYLAHNQKWSGNENLKNIWSGVLHGTDDEAGSGTDSGDIVNTWKNNDVTVEILQQVPGVETNYGIVYPYAKLQKDIDANVLYIASGHLHEIAKGENISYKGVGLKNGLRNNPIRLSEQYPKSLKVELDFPQGLYKTRSEVHNERSSVTYKQIPMWVAIQWRVYSEENDKADGENAGTLPIPLYDYNNHKYELIDGKVKRGWNTFEVINKVNVGWEESDKKATVYVHMTITESSHQGFRTVNVSKITSNKQIDSKFYIEVKGYDDALEEKINIVYPANRTSYNVNRSITVGPHSFQAEVTITPELPNYNGGRRVVTQNTIDEEGVAFAVGINSNVSTYTISDRVTDIAAHTGNSLSALESLNSGWVNQQVFNLKDLGGSDQNLDGINEFRCVSEVDLINWAEQNLREQNDTDEEFVNKVKSYFFDSTNSTKSIEVRVVRISPNYIDETTSTNEHSAYKFYDIFTWRTLTSTMLDGDELLYNNSIKQKRPLPEEDFRKLCLISLKAKTDNVDQLSNTIRKFSCIAESFAPYYDDIQKKWLPENVTKKKGYYRYVDNGGEKEWITITEEQYYQDRQSGYAEAGLKSKCLPNGNNFLEQITDLIYTNEHIDEDGRIYLPDNDSVIKFCNNNVASMFLLGGIGAHLGNDALGYSQSDFENNTIGDFNIDSLTKWYKWAESVIDGSTYSSDGYHYNHNGERVNHSKGDLVQMYFTANAYIYSTETLEQMLANIAIAGRAVFTRDNKNRICTIVDKPEKYPVALINQQNTLKSSYTISYSELPSGIQITFPDEDDGYTQNQLYCMTDGEDKKNPHGAIEPYGFKFVTNNKQAWSLGRYLLANRVLNREVIIKQLGMEGASLGLGDLVLVQDDTMLIGTDNGGIITQLIEDENDIYGFVINNSYHFTGETEEESQQSAQGVVVMQPGKYKEYRIITLRLAPLGTTVTVNEILYKQEKGNTNLVLFNTPIAKTQQNQNENDFYVYRPEVGNIVGFGIVGKVTEKYRIIKIKTAERNKYDFTLIKYQEDLYNYGKELPSFQNNMTIPDRSNEDSFSLSYNATQSDLQATIASAADQSQGMINNTFSKVPPVPSNITVTVDRDKLHISCAVSGDGVNNVDYILYEIKRHDNTVKQINGKYSEDSFFDRTVDGYPEYEDLVNWQVRAKAISLYTNEEHEKIASDWSSYVNITQASLNLYGTWHIPSIAAIKEVVDRTVIISAIYTGTQQRVLYGTPVTKVKIRRIGNYDCEESLTGVVEVIEIPQNPNVGDIIHYLGPDVKEDDEIVFKHGNYYRYTSQLVWEKAGRTFNEILGIEEDVDQEGNPCFYTPDFNRSVQYSEKTDNEPHYRLDTLDEFELTSNKLTHTLPLIGQTSRIFKTGNIFTGTFTKDVVDYSTIPQNPQEGDIIHYIGETRYQGTEPEYINNAYYLYEDNIWQQVYAKVLTVPTTYEYSIQMVNESGYSTNVLITQATALNTSISDVVRSHEHYKELYVEKLSAISANVGMLRQGGMGDFNPNTGNYWALSDIYPEDSGFASLIKKGAFRVGGRDQYFKVTPDPNNPDKYDIELKAGNITLTSQGDGTSFTSGTYIYDSSDPNKRLWLTATGIIAQEYRDIGTTQNPNMQWVNVSRVIIDAKGNMIITNSDNPPAYGFQREGAIYHFDNYEHPEYEEVPDNESPTNPEDIVCTGTVVPTDNNIEGLNCILYASSSPNCIKGTVEKNLSTNNFEGDIVLFSKAEKIVIQHTAIDVEGNFETNIPDLLIGYNEAMREISTEEPNKTVGEYLGLTQAQINKGIFY